MVRKALTAFAILLVLVLAASATLAHLHGPKSIPAQSPGALDAIARLLGPDVEPAAQISGSGYIEGRHVTIAAEQGGRIVAIQADEGDVVEQGAALIRFDDELLRAQYRKALAGLHLAEAALRRLEAGATPEEIRRAEAVVLQAEASEQAAHRGWENAVSLRDNPQELDAQIDQARARLLAARHQLTGATANKDAAELSMDVWERTVGILNDGVDYSKRLPFGPAISGHMDFRSGEINQASDQWNRATNTWWQSWIGVDSAVIQIEDAEQHLNDLFAMRSDPQAGAAQVDRAWAAYEAALAATGGARAQLDLVRAGSRPDRIASARAQVAQAQARLDRVQTQIDKTVLGAPMAGLVTRRAVSLGEVAEPGTALMEVADLSRVTLTVYVPEDAVGLVNIGQEASISIDSYPGMQFPGRVTLIASEAEFTPKSVQSARERVNVVFAVEITAQDADHRLKPGMPADAVIDIGGEGSPARLSDGGIDL